MSILRCLLALCIADAAFSMPGPDQQVDDSHLSAAWITPAEDMCGAEDESCALSLRQLRAQQSQLAAPQKAAEGGPPPQGSTDERVDDRLAQQEVSEERVAEQLVQRAASTRAVDSGDGDDDVPKDGGDDGNDDASMDVGLESAVRAKPGGAPGPIQSVYHQTSPEIGAAILREGFRPGHGGWCGGAIYFATTPQATYGKAIGAESHHGFIIEAKVDVGRVKYMPKKCAGWMTGQKLNSMGFDSIRFNPGDGDEIVIYDPSRVLSMEGVKATPPPPGARP